MSVLATFRAWRTRRRHARHLRWLRRNHVLYGLAARPAPDERSSIERFRNIQAVRRLQ